jgi:hypothetical protein
MTDVTPITPSHVCASCKATISTLDVYAGHTEQCMQPEVRFRRMERRIAELHELFYQMPGMKRADCRWCGGCYGAHTPDCIGHRIAILETKHGISEEPSTQRTGGTSGLGGADARGFAGHYGIHDATGFSVHCQACNPGRTRADPSPAEPGGTQADSAVPAGSEPERSG